METDNTSKFTGKAEIYAKVRPDYPSGVYQFILSSADLSQDNHVADIGSGTGIFSEGLLKRVYNVYCVEPNDDMRSEAEKRLSQYNGFISVNGTAERTGLSDDSVDLVTAAQAFHWFNADLFKTECRRILKKGGKAALIWNHHILTDESVQENAELLRGYCPQFKGFSGGLNDIKDKIISFFSNGFLERAFANPLNSQKSKFVECALSASYSLTEDDMNYQDYIDGLEKFFDKYAVNGTYTMPNETIVYYGEV